MSELLAKPGASKKNPYNLPPFKDRIRETVATYLRFGYTTFGGPSAHVGYLYDEIVIKRQWVSSQHFTELFAISQSLPGPGSTELAYSLVLVRSGFTCAVLAFLFWSIPGTVVMTVAGFLIGNIKGDIPVWATRLEQGLAAASIGLVALAGYRMSTTLATDKLTRILALIAGSVTALYSAPWLLPVVMVSGGLISYTFDSFIAPVVARIQEKKDARKKAALDVKEAAKDLEQGHTNRADIEQGEEAAGNTTNNENTADTIAETAASIHGSIRSRGKTEVDIVPEYTEKPELEDMKKERKLYSYSKKVALVLFGGFLLLLIGAIVVRAVLPIPEKAEVGYLAATFYFVGSIIFGGGPVIIPLLKTYTVDSGWMTDQQYLVGLALIQSLPGPNFNFAAFLGAVAMANANGNSIAGAVVCYLAIFLPGLVLKTAIIPFWQTVRDHPAVKKVFRGVNACALGLVFSAVWLLWVQTNIMGGHAGFHGVIVSAAFVAVAYLDMPSPLAIIIGGGMGAIEYAVSG